jgi:hypothetical protein
MMSLGIQITPNQPKVWVQGRIRCLFGNQMEKLKWRLLDVIAVDCSRLHSENNHNTEPMGFWVK